MIENPNLKQRDQKAQGGVPQRPAGSAANPPSTASTARATPPAPPPRLTSLDAYRGFIMTMLAAGGFGIYAFTQIDPASPLWQTHDHAFWQKIGFHFEHPEWESKFGLMGVSFWDLIQPAFMFMVGVSMPFSYRRRSALGQQSWTRHLHAVVRALVLVLLGVFLYSEGHAQTNWIFPNVLCQIGLGYLFAYALLGCKWYWQTAAIVVILAGYWGVFYVNPPPKDHDYAAVLTEEPVVVDPDEAPLQEGDAHADEGASEDAETEGEGDEADAEDNSVPTADITPSIGTTYVLFDSSSGAGAAADPVADGQSDIGTGPPLETEQPDAELQPVDAAAIEEEERIPGQIYQGQFAPWSKNGNFAHFTDVKLLNMFPRPDSGRDDGEGERDGVDDDNGQFLYNGGGYQTLNFVPSIATMLLGVLCGQLLLGPWGAWKKVGALILLGGVCFGLSLAAEMVCPVVKRIWTPSWVLFSGAYVIWGLALFYMLFDALPLKVLAFPLVVVGMNSILIYLVGELIGGWTIQQVHTHFGISITDLFGSSALDPQMYGPIVENSAKFVVFWLIFYWLYRQRYFIRI